MTVFDSIISLRRDNDYNYEKTKDSFIPAKGELCLVDTARNGLRAKVGDGQKTYAQLQFIDEDIAFNTIIKGYLHEGNFYYEKTHENVIEPSTNKMFIDLDGTGIYYYSGTEYLKIVNKPEQATSTVAGIAKLYTNVGDNEDGSMTQKAIKDISYSITADNASQTITISKL